MYMEPRSGFGIYTRFQFVRHLPNQPVVCHLCHRRMKEAKTRPMRQNFTYCELGAKFCTLEFGLNALYSIDDGCCSKGGRFVRFSDDIF